MIGFRPGLRGWSASRRLRIDRLACFVNVWQRTRGACRSGVPARICLYVGYASLMVMAFLEPSKFVDGGSPVLRYVAVVLYSAVGGLIPGSCSPR